MNFSKSALYFALESSPSCRTTSGLDKKVWSHMEATCSGVNSEIFTSFDFFCFAMKKENNGRVFKIY
jgi:hypothetical protein